MKKLVITFEAPDGWPDKAMSMGALDEPSSLGKVAEERQRIIEVLLSAFNVGKKEPVKLVSFKATEVTLEVPEEVDVESLMRKAREGIPYILESMELKNAAK